MKLSLLIALLAELLIYTGSASAHPEFQIFIEENSGRNVNCAMCHVHSDGPEGAGRGQVGALTEEEMNLLLLARGAFEPGREVNSPILNDFGNYMVKKLGKQAILEFRNDPVQIAIKLTDHSDLDEDGIPDAQEYLSGTHPLMKTHGSPILLFWNNVFFHRFHLVMMLLATAFGIWGLSNLLNGVDHLQKIKK